MKSHPETFVYTDDLCQRDDIMFDPAVAADLMVFTYVFRKKTF